MTQKELKQRLIELLVECDMENDVLDVFPERPLVRQTAEVIANSLIANGVTIRERGEWKDNTFCSRCGYFAEDDEGHILMSFDEFCPFCGADLRGVKDE